jgi:phytoene desaturase
MPKKIAIIGSGISGLSAASYLAKEGADVHVFEKNSQAGGRARQFTTSNGYTFDMGPSWYWMPDIIDGFFKDFDAKASDFYELIRLDPQFDMIFHDGMLSLPDNYQDMKHLFERIEPGSAAQLDRFMAAAKAKYEIGMTDFVTKPCLSWLEFLSIKTAKGALKLDLLTDYRSYVKKFFSHPMLIALMEFPVIFLGAPPKDIPALYSLMNYGGYGLGTFYPMGGFYELVKAMEAIALRQGVQFHFDNAVEQIITDNNKVNAIKVNGNTIAFDAVVASSDYHHSETLLEKQYRNYPQSYWDNKTFAPSCLIFYLGFSEKIPKLKHHTLFFENDFDEHIDNIYKDAKWPEKPLFYACCPSKTDATVAPQGHENVFLLMPLAIGMEDSEATREQYLPGMLQRIEAITGATNLLSKIDHKRSYCGSDFIMDYNAFKGNAYGLANTLRQTAVLKPSIRNKKLKNLYYTGQLTVPGPGVPPSIISGKIVAKEINKNIPSYEKAV